IVLLQENADEANAAFRKGLAINPRNPEAHVNLGQSLLGQGKTDAALIHIREAVRLAPRNATARIALASALQAWPDKGNEAEIESRKAVELEPWNPTGYIALAGALQSKGEIQQAIVESRKAVDL